MKKLNLIIMTLVAVMALAACNDGVTYADLKKKERNAINRYITSHKIQKITEAEFEKKGFVTDTTKNEYVLFESTGVYMQIVRKGGGEKLKDGETATVLCRFKEYNILEGDSALQLTNITQYNWQVDKMSVKNTSGTFTGSFISGESLMYSKYSTQAVPSGWLVPLTYINLGRIPKGEERDRATLRRTFTRASTNSRLSVADSLTASHLTISTPHHLNT